MHLKAIYIKRQHSNIFWEIYWLQYFNYQIIYLKSYILANLDNINRLLKLYISKTIKLAFLRCYIWVVWNNIFKKLYNYLK